MKPNMRSHGKHLILDLELEKQVFPDQMLRFLTILPDRIAMRKIKRPVVVKAIDYPYGITGFVILSTSHISFHEFQYKDGTVRMGFDMYSCRNFSVIKVMKVMRELIGKYKVIQKEVHHRYA